MKLTYNSQLEVLKYRDFKMFVWGRLCYITALRMAFTAVGYLVYKITQSKLQLGYIGLSEVVPAIGLALYAGVVVDKSNKRKLILQAEVMYLLISIATTVIVHGYVKEWLSPQAIIPLLLSMMFLGGIVRAYNGPAQNAIIAQLVPKQYLVMASTISSIVWLTGAVIGPVLSGLLLYYTNAIICFGVVTGLVTISILFKWHISSTEVVFTKAITNWAAIKEGVQFVYRTKIILGALCLDLFAVLFGGAVALLPVYAQDILHVDALGLGWLNSAEYIGSFVIMILLLLVPIRRNQGIKLLWAVTGFGVCTILFAISTHFWVSMAALLAIGIFDGVSVIIRGNIMQLYTPNELRGRVSSVNSMFINSSNEIGQMESGIAATVMGTSTSVVFGGTITLIVVALVWRYAPSLKKLSY